MLEHLRKPRQQHVNYFITCFWWYSSAPCCIAFRILHAFAQTDNRHEYHHLGNLAIATVCIWTFFVTVWCSRVCCHYGWHYGYVTLQCSIFDYSLQNPSRFRILQHWPVATRSCHRGFRRWIHGKKRYFPRWNLWEWFCFREPTNLIDIKANWSIFQITPV